LLNRLLSMLRKELIQALRDRRLRVFAFAPPLFQLIVFGYAADLDVRHIKTAVVDQARTPESRALVESIRQSGHFDLIAFPDRTGQLLALFDRAEVTLAIHIPSDLSARLATGRQAAIQLILDGTDSQAAQVANSYATRIILDFGQERLRGRLEVLKGFLARDTGTKVERLLAGVDLASRVWYNPNLISRNFFVPGIVALILTIMTLMMTSMSIVRERELGTLEQLLVTPLRPAEFILGKTIPFALIGYGQATLILLAGVFWFNIPFVGSAVFFYVATGLYLLNSLSLGLLISTISRTQQQAMTTTFLFLFPAILFSGFVFPISSMPEPIQWLTLLNPLRYFITLLRDIFLKGSPPLELWPQLLGLCLIGPSILAVAASRVRRQLG